MSHAYLEVVRIMSGRDFHCTRTEFRVDATVGNDDDVTSQKRMGQRLTDEVAVSLIVWMHGNGGITEHRLQAGRRHDDVGLVIVHRSVPERHQFALDVLVFDLEV